MMKNKKLWICVAVVMLLVVCLVLWGIKISEKGTESIQETAIPEATATANTLSNVSTATRELDGYKLEQMVIFSRHNVRAPVVSMDSDVGKMTPNKWIDFSANAGELTLIGGAQETAMGQYFRKYLISRGLMEDDWIPEEGQVRIYSNSYQRTIATARYFSAGFLPIGNTTVEYHNEVGEMDPVFNPCLNYMSDAYSEHVQNEISALASGKGIQGVVYGISDDLAFMYELLDFADSEYAKEHNVTAIATDDTKVVLKQGEEPKMTGGLKTINSTCDALIMQYYDADNAQDADFGKNLTLEQWKAIGRINGTYQDILFGLKDVAVNVSHPLLMEIKDELTDEERIFTLLCGHDSNVETLMVCLGIEDFERVDNISSGTPIGCKLVWERLSDENGDEYIRMSFVYQASEKLRDNELVTLNNPPCWIELELTGLSKNADGLYRMEDVLTRFDEAISAYDALPADEDMELPLAA